MSYFRPPVASPWIVWGGRAVAVAGAALGIAAYTQGVGFPGVSEALQAIGNSAGPVSGALAASEAFTPLVLGTLGSLAIWRSAEKADEVGRDSRAYQRGLDRALDDGVSEIHLPSRLLQKEGQVSWLTSSLAMTVGALVAIAGGFLIYSGLMGSLSSVVSGVPNLLNGILMTAAGYTGWKVGSIAAEAREFSYSVEASAERGRIAEAEAAQSVRMERYLNGLEASPALTAPLQSLPLQTPPTPLTDRFRAEQSAPVAPSPKAGGFLARLSSEREAAHANTDLAHRG